MIAKQYLQWSPDGVSRYTIVTINNHTIHGKNGALTSFRLILIKESNGQAR